MVNEYSAAVTREWAPGMHSAWDDLKSAIRGPIERFEWWQACVDGLPGLGEIQPWFIHDSGKCAAIAPLVLRPGLLPRLESIGVRQLHEPMDFIYADRRALAVLCDALARQRLPIDLQRVPLESPLVDELRRAFKGRALVLTRRNRAYPVLNIDRGWTAESHFNAGRCSDFRRAMRKAQQAGGVRFEVIEPPLAELDALLAEAYGVELQGWKGRKGTALAIDPLRSGFYRRYFRACAERGILRLAFLRIDGVAVAMQIAVHTDERLWLLKIGHNETYARMSPGTLLMLHVIRHAAQTGIRSIEFLGSVEPWTRMWTNAERQFIHISVYPLGLLAAAAFVADVLAWAGSRLRHLRGLPTGSRRQAA